MGKDSKHQRTTGGVQPSSASRTAELLQKAGAAGQSLSFLAAAAEVRQEFSAFSANVLPTLGSGSPVHSILANVLIDDDLPPEVRLIFRKLQKKDATTKIKALGELFQMYSSGEGNSGDSSANSVDEGAGDKSSAKLDPQELSKIILPQWSKCFPKLTVDDSRKVRELTQTTHAVICKAMGRNLAVFLKQIMPHWYLAQFDIYGPVTSAAKKSYQAVFPNETKQLEVIKFCIAEIVANISSNLDTVFRIKRIPEQKKKEKKKQGTAKKKEDEDDNQEKDTGSVPAVPEISLASAAVVIIDSESYEIRTSFATLQAIINLIHIRMVDGEFLEFLFGKEGVFWDGAELTKFVLIRRSCFDLLSTYLSTTSQDSKVPEIVIPVNRCTTLMNSALSATQKEILPSVWNTFLILTLKGTLKDTKLAQQQLLTCCKNGFYGNASQISTSFLPFLAKVWEGLTDEEKTSKFASDLTKSFIKGYEGERSNFEKAAILRTFAETIAFMIKNGVCDMDSTIKFIVDNLKHLNSEFPKFLGALVKDEKFYDALMEKAIENNILNTKEFGDFVVGLVTQPASLFLEQKPVRKGVQFKDDSLNSTNTSVQSSFENLPPHKQTFLQNFVKTCISNNSYMAVSIVYRHFRNASLWSLINITSIDLSKEDDIYTRLRLSLDLIELHPDNPQVLSIFSDQFETFKQPENLHIFLKELTNFIHIKPIKKWLRMALFTDVIENSVISSNLKESELSLILKFVLNDTFSETFVQQICTALVHRMDSDVQFYENLARIMAYTIFKVDVSGIYGRFWELYLQKTVNASEDLSLELAESVCIRNYSKLSSGFLMDHLKRQLDLCQTVKQVDSLVELCKKLNIPDDDIELVLVTPSLNINPDMLAFTGFCFSNINENMDLIRKFSVAHKSVILTSIFHGRLVQNNDAEDLVQPLMRILYAQAIGRVWMEVEKSEYFEHLSEDLIQELDVLSSRLIETMYTKSTVWKEFKTQIQQACNSSDPIWKCKLPSRILFEYCQKSEVKYDIPCAPRQATDDLEGRLEQLLEDFAAKMFRIKESVSWITNKRNDNSDDFEFETIYKHTKNKCLINKILLLTIELLQNLDTENEEFLSTGACWVEAWLKHSKNLEISSKTHLGWISNLCRAVKIIGDRARSTTDVCPKFVEEYLGFHCAQIYPVIYALYLQLNENTNHNFWTMQALHYTSCALVSMPGTTLAFIEPECIKASDLFSNILGNGINQSTRIAAYRVLRKVKYDIGEAKDLPIVPPGVDQVIRSLMGNIKVPDADEADNCSRQQYEKEKRYLVSYLLIWDALLKIQQSSNEFASYVRDREHLLTPFLNILFFSEYIPLENANSKCFDTDPFLVPGSKINLLHLSCSVLQRVLRNLPYTVRWWWNTHVTKQRDRVFVEKYVIKHLSSKLAVEELGGVKLREGVDDNVNVQCHSGCNELVAHYRIEETNVTLTIMLPLNHPLGPVTVKISDKKLHAKISHLLNTRSHSLSAGLKMWKENLDGLYKDVDECAICFFIIHHVTKQTPKLACKTCRKKFHAACLYKWFSTSNKSECPLCRNLF